MAGGLPDPATYPAEELADIAARAVRDHGPEVLGYSRIDGLPALRDRLAARFSDAHVQLTRENVLVTTAGMQALDLVGKVLLEPSGRITAHSPTYLGAIDAWKPYRPQYRPFTPDGSEDYNQVFSGAQFVYTVPNFSNPSGRLVDVDQRRTMVEAAHLTGTWLVEDDPYGGLYYEGEPLPRLLSLSGERQGPVGNNPYRGPVIYTGTLSKEVAPGLRIGWVIAAPEMIAAMVMAKQGSDMCTSGLTQRIALMAMEAGLAERMQPRILALYRERRDALCQALSDHLAASFTWQKPQGGMFVWAVARDPDLDTDALMRVGLEEGVCITPSSVFDVTGRNHGAMRINFTFNSPERIVEGIKRLAKAVARLSSK
nr:PLP-dependent aminotransferase family protein [Tianweitania sediminis]